MARRGYVFENEINRILRFLNEHGIHAHKNNASRLFDGTYTKGEPFDYEVFVKGKLFCFDAKECAAERWNLSNAKPNQIKALWDCYKHGAEAFFLVKFTNKALILKFPIAVVRDIMRRGEKSLGVENGVKFDWKREFLGVGEQQLTIQDIKESKHPAD